MAVTLPKGAQATEFLKGLPSPIGSFIIGERIHHQVYKGRLTKQNSTSTEVAVKIIDYCEGDTDEEEYIAAEILINQTLTKAKTEGINYFIGAFRSPWVTNDAERGGHKHTYTHSVILLNDLCKGGSIADFAAALIKNADILDVSTSDPRAFPLAEPGIAFCCRSILRALKTIHKLGFVHKDIKGANILFSDKGHPLVADFGVTSAIPKSDERIYSAVGTPYWMAPEVCACDLPEGHTYNEKADVWALAITAIELAQGRPPHAHKSATGAMMAIPASPPPRLTMESMWSVEFKDFLAKCLVKDYEKRPTAEELLKHSFVSAKDRVNETSITSSPHFGQAGTFTPGTGDQEMLQERRRSAKRRDEVIKSKSNQYDDLASLAELTETSMLDELKRRFMKDHIYTYVGDVLVSINPFVSVPLFGPEESRYYNLASAKDHLKSPHIYATALQSYRSMCQTEENQSCVISGESGAGKTEAAKYFVSHLLDLSRGENLAMVYKYDVLQFTMNSLLEPFGNASLAANHNSSRFGKYVGLQFDQHHQIVGARMSHYLLEKSRVASQLPKEQNFHIFYLLLEGVDDGALTALKLTRDERAYAYLNGGIDPSSVVGMNLPPSQSGMLRAAARAFNHLVQQMLEAGFKPSDLDGMYALIAVVLHLGNLDFNKEESEATHYFDLTITGPLQTLVSLLGCQSEDLANSLVTNIIVMRGETIIIKNTVATARASRDSMAKALYSRMFSWLVNCANRLMEADNPPRANPVEIGVLDIFGFENLHVNGFEQLCINVANEQLQHFFNTSIFQWQAEALQSEGINLDEVQYIDNTETMELFITTPLGLFALLDEETKFPNATDTTLLQKLDHHLSHHPAYKMTRMQKQSSSLLFGVRHYAGTIHYSVTGWLDKNKDALTPGITSILRDSKIELVSELFSLSQTATGGLESDGLQDKMVDRQHNARALIRTLRNSVWKRSSDKDITGAPSPSRNLRGVKNKAPQVRRIDKLPPLTLSKTQRNANLNSLSQHFKASLVDLMIKLTNSNPHFVRCMRPNTSARPHVVEDELLMEQMRNTGLLETVRIRRDGYASQVVFSDFITRYRGLHYRLLDTVSPSREACENILATVGLPLSLWQIGKTKVFLKYRGAQLLLEKLQVVKANAARAVNIVQVIVATRKYRGMVQAKIEAAKQKLLAEKEAARAAKAERKRLAREKREAARKLEEMKAAEALKQKAELERQKIALEEKKKQLELNKAKLLQQANDDNARAEREKEKKMGNGNQSEIEVLSEAEQIAARKQQLLQRAINDMKNSPSPPKQQKKKKKKKKAPRIYVDEDGDTFGFDVEDDPPTKAGESGTEYGFGDSADNTTDYNTDDEATTNAGSSPPRPVSRSPTRKGKKRGSAFFKDRLPKLLSTMPVESEFWDADLNMAGSDEIPEPCVALCRYKNILPNAKTIVKLEAVEGVSGEEKMLAEFINANYIRGVQGMGEKRYIATQGPKPNTTDHFWRMVWEQNTALIVMVTGVMEGGRVKCHAYWPTEEGETMYILPTNIMVTNKCATEDKGIRITQLAIEFNDVVRHITHMQYTGWPDQSVPKNVRDMANSFVEIRKHTAKQAPIVVHCSAGVGRTGVIIACDMALDALDLGQPVNFFDIMVRIREDRGCMIQTYEQLLLVYRIVGRYIKLNPASSSSTSKLASSTSSTPRRQSIVDEKAVLEESISRADMATEMYPQDYTHPSQRVIEEVDDDASVPSWRLTQKTERTAELDAVMAEEEGARVSNRYFEKRKLDMHRRDSAEMLINRIESLPVDDIVDNVDVSPSKANAQAPPTKPKPKVKSNQTPEKSPTPNMGKQGRRSSFIGRRLSMKTALNTSPTKVPSPKNKRKPNRRMSVRNAVAAVTRFIGVGKDKLSEENEEDATDKDKGTADDDTIDEAEEYDPETLEDSLETLSFLTTLESNRSLRAQEEASRKLELAAEFKKAKDEEQRRRDIEIAGIEAQAAKEKEIAEAKTDEHVAEAMDRVAGLTFDFTFG